MEMKKIRIMKKKKKRRKKKKKKKKRKKRKKFHFSKMTFQKQYKL
jgi:hypothetical protein